MTRHRSCVGDDGRFIVGIHRPRFYVHNLRENDFIQPLGKLENDELVMNHANFPDDSIKEDNADIIYEIANAFGFRGTTYINSAWADVKALHPESIKIHGPESCSFLDNMTQGLKELQIENHNEADLLDILPHPLVIALAQASTDSHELCLLAKKSCKILFNDSTGLPSGIEYKKLETGKIIPTIYDHELFEVVVNNAFLPDDYKNALVLKPGVQGTNEITGEYSNKEKKIHVFEYLRRNSYIPWGHFASNMANDAIRYRSCDLTEDDMTGIRHLYYQRAYIRMAHELGVAVPSQRKQFTQIQLEELRNQILDAIETADIKSLNFNTTLWGWNYGFGYAQSGHRLHASHQMIHQQNAMIPREIPTTNDGTTASFACGDQIAEFIEQFYSRTGKSFFKTYMQAIRSNTRTDGNEAGSASLIVAEDDYSILFVPKAQICEFELQLMTKEDCGNIFEADSQTRASLDKGILTAVQILEFLGTGMVTSIEYSKRLDSGSNGQRLLYDFIPKLPYAPGTFSEAQQRWICGLYPEDFAEVCRNGLLHL